MHELPLFGLAELEHLAEQLLGLLAREKVLLVGSALIRVAGRNRNRDVHLFAEIEELRDVLGRMAIENGRVDVDGEALPCAALMPATARSKPPSMHTDLS